MLYPFTSREDSDFFQHLEMHMRQEHPPLLGRDHLAYRCARGWRAASLACRQSLGAPPLGLQLHPPARMLTPARAPQPHSSTHPPTPTLHRPTRSSFYFPVRDCVDGDLCEQFPQLPADKQRAVGEELDRSPGEVLKKLEDMRNRII